MAFRNPYPPLEIPDVALSDFILERIEDHGDKPAILDVDGGLGYSYAQVGELVRKTAAGFAERGITFGQRVAVMLPNVPEYPIVFHGILRAGGVVTTLNPMYTAHEIGFQLADSGAQFVVADAESAETARAAAATTGAEVLVLGEPGAPGALGVLLGDGPVPDVTIAPATDLAALPYSSGTTGFPKGVMLTHRNLVANLLQTAASQDVGEDDVLAGILPFFHIYGMTVIMNLALWRGATIISVRKFGVQRMLRAIEEYRVTRLYAAPPIVLALVQHPDVDDADLSNLRFVLSGAAPLGADVALQCEKRIGCRVVQGYGLTETSPCTHLTADRYVDVPKASVGHALPDTECRVVDVASGKDVGPNESGELWVRGPQVMFGYLNNPQATADVIDADGYFHTGDIVRIDEDGCCFIVDRLKELIKHKGFQIAPAELEAVLLEHEAVADAAVIGVPDASAGEVPMAFVVLRDGASATGEELRVFVSERVAAYKLIGAVELIDAIPRTASGKIQRRVLRDRQRAEAEA